MNSESSPQKFTRSLIALFFLLVALPVGFLTPLAQAKAEYVLNEMASTRSGVAFSVQVLEDYSFVTGNGGVSVFDVSDTRRARWRGGLHRSGRGGPGHSRFR